jgi:hypothetical protein
VDTHSQAEWKSIEVVRKELDIERELQAKIADTCDSRAGVVLGFAGAVAGLAANSKVLLANVPDDALRDARRERDQEGGSAARRQEL